jgi:prevent-host-death family protein
MARSISLVAARKDLGRIVEEVGRTGHPVNLTRRGKIVARIVPDAGRAGDAVDPLAALRGTAEFHGSFGQLTRELRNLREEAGAALEQRVTRIPRSAQRGDRAPRAKPRA